MPMYPERDILIEFLNHVAAVDPHALDALMALRAPCTAALASHSLMRAAAPRDAARGDEPAIGVLELLHGLCRTLDPGAAAGDATIEPIYAADGRLLAFRRSDRPAPS